MTETLMSFPIDIGDVLDVDFRSDGSLISLQGFGRRQVLVLPEGSVELPDSWPAADYPHLRAIAPGRLLLIDNSSEDVRANSQYENAFLISESGLLLSRFHLGAGVIDACPVAGAFAVAYHPDAAHEFGLEAGPMASVGVGIFDATGRLAASLNRDLELDGYNITNVQCLVPRENGELVVVPEFLSTPKGELTSPLVFYDWRTGRIRIEETKLSRPLALSCTGANLLVYSPEEAEDELLLCDMKGREIKSLGFYQHVYRGLPSGRLLAQLSGVQYSLLEIPKDAVATKDEKRKPRLALQP